MSLSINRRFSSCRKIILTVGLLFFIIILLKKKNSYNQSSTIIIEEKDTESDCFIRVLQLPEFNEVIQSYRELQQPVYKELLQPISHSSLTPFCHRYFLDHQLNIYNVSACFNQGYSRQFIVASLRPALKIIKEAFHRENIELILASGSLLGSWRYHGLIPYDDDVDFRTPSTDKGRVSKLLMKLAANWTKSTRFVAKAALQLDHFKLGIACNTPDQLGSCTQQIDFFFNTRTKSGWNLYGPPWFVPDRVLYPLQMRPFEGDLYKTFNNFKKFFRIWYGSGSMEECVHRLKDRNKAADQCMNVRVDCKMLHHKFHYVKRQWIDHLGGMVELLINKSDIQAVFITPHSK